MNTTPEERTTILAELRSMDETFSRALIYHKHETRLRLGVVIFFLSMICFTYISHHADSDPSKNAFTVTYYIQDQDTLQIIDPETGISLNINVRENIPHYTQLFSHSDPRYPGFFYNNDFLHDPARLNTTLPSRDTRIDIAYLNFEELSNIEAQTEVHFSRFTVPQNEFIERDGLLTSSNSHYIIITRDLTTSLWNLRIFSTTSETDHQLISLGQYDRAVLMAVSPNGLYSVLNLGSTDYLLNIQTGEKSQAVRGSYAHGVTDTGEIITSDLIVEDVTKFGFFYSGNLRYLGSNVIVNEIRGDSYYTEAIIIDTQTGERTTYGYQTDNTSGVRSITSAGFPIINVNAERGSGSVTFFTLTEDNIITSSAR